MSGMGLVGIGEAARTLGLNPSALRYYVDQSSDAWRDHLTQQIARLDDLIARATLARDFLTHARNCPADHPVDQCPRLIEVLDRRLDGVTFEQLLQEHAVGREAVRK